MVSGAVTFAPASDPSLPSPAAAPPVAVFHRCGVVAPLRASACSVCAQPLVQTRTQVPALQGELFWVAVRCAFTCNSCRFLAPLDALDADGAVDCACCGLRQRFDLSAWTEALAFAHAVGDLAGPSPEGRFPHASLWIGSENPYAAIGDTETFQRREGISSSGLAVEAAPGHPVCGTCHVPLSTTVTGAGGVVTQCPRCGERATYALGNGAQRLSSALVAAMAHEHRTDRPRARTNMTQGGVIALTCPSCGAPLTLAGGGRVQTCSFCHASCIVPARRPSQPGAEAQVPEVWWLLFHGASDKRRELEAPTEGTSTALQTAVGLMLPGRGDTAPIGDAPGVYAAPRAKGIYWPQVALTLIMGSVGVALGFVVYALLR